MLIGTASSNQIYTELRETLIHERENSLMVSDWAYITSFYKQKYSAGRTRREAKFWLCGHVISLYCKVSWWNEIVGKIHWFSSISNFQVLSLGTELLCLEYYLFGAVIQGPASFVLPLWDITCISMGPHRTCYTHSSPSCFPLSLSPPVKRSLSSPNPTPIPALMRTEDR